MRKINYTIFPDVGPGEEQVEGTVLDLFKDLPYVLGRFIPPLLVVNNILESGVMDAGMSGGCIWKPFQVGTDEYDELVEVLKKEGLKAIEPPEWVTTYAYWKIWELERIAGVPSYEHKRLHELYERLEEANRVALKEGRQADAEQIQKKLFDAGNSLADFVNCHIRR